MALHDRPVRGLARTVQRALDQLLAVDGERQRAPDRRIAQHGVTGRQRSDARVRRADLEHVVVAVLAGAAGELGHDPGRVDEPFSNSATRAFSSGTAVSTTRLMFGAPRK